MCALRRGKRTLALTSFVVLAFLLAVGSAGAIQIAPNPNPAGNTITVSGADLNSGIFSNDGTIDINAGGTLDNNGWLSNFSSGTINNDSGGTITSRYVLDNNGTLNNDGTFENVASSIFYNGSAIGTISTINNDSGGTISNRGTLDNNGTLNNDGIFNNNALYVGGSDTINNRSGGTFNNDGSMFDSHLNNDGIFNNTGSMVDSVLNNDGIFNNTGTLDASYIYNPTGTINNDSVGTITNRLDFLFTGGTLNNDGTFENVASATFQHGRNSTTNNAGTFRNDGVIFNGGTLNNDGEILNQGVFSNDSGGTYGGSGTFIGTFENYGGTVAPGNSAGTTTIDGDFAFFNGILELEIGWMSGTLVNDLVNVTGSAFLTGGEILFQSLGGYRFGSTLAPGSSLSLEFLHADGGIFGSDGSFPWDPATFAVSFGNPLLPAGFDWLVSERGNGLWLDVTNNNPVPEPSTFLLLGAGLFTLAVFRKRFRSVS